ncbi:MAG: T9SS type A sorting domain-containing protein, partial [Candidatus Krumholzibacteria bacterium]|nr:T9SS type A sorting domain-containing protein [Candidatus Krumholzibacteria bacterium]
QNYPNPFNPVTTIHYGLKEPVQVTLEIFNVAGQRVRTLVDEQQAPRAGGFTVRWDGMNDRGDSVASGVYFYRLRAGTFMQTRKMALLR